MDMTEILIPENLELGKTVETSEDCSWMIRNR